MTKEIKLKIKFSRALNEDEQNACWDNLVDEIEKLNLYAGGMQDKHGLGLVIDCTYSKKKVSEIKRSLLNYLNNQNQFISKYKIKYLTA